jgi:hypothetical protein
MDSLILDVYQRTTNPACLAQFGESYRGLVADHGTNGEHNDFNDLGPGHGAAQ